jgi:anthranilate phosphoribosyltransferase
MNMLGPCLNPAGPKVQLLGVADPRMLAPIALTLMALGVERALVVHGAGLDEVALHGETEAIRVADGKAERLLVRPEDAGLDRVPASALAGGDPVENAGRLEALLDDHGTAAERDAVILNTAALLLAAGKAESLTDGAVQARKALATGQAGERLRAFVEASRG